MSATRCDDPLSLNQHRIEEYSHLPFPKHTLLTVQSTITQGLGEDTVQYLFLLKIRIKPVGLPTSAAKPQLTVLFLEYLGLGTKYNQPAVHFYL